MMSLAVIVVSVVQGGGAVNLNERSGPELLCHSGSADLALSTVLTSSFSEPKMLMLFQFLHPQHSTREESVSSTQAQVIRRIKAESTVVCWLGGWRQKSTCVCLSRCFTIEYY